jgi:hypothetical protein
MTAFMLAAQRLGLMGKIPPSKITDAVLDRLGAGRTDRRLWTTLFHVGFGAAAGALYGLVRRRRPRPVRAALEGATFGTGVWAASYAGWVPALGIMPPPDEDRPGRPAAMVAAHWIFGGTLGALYSWMRRAPS